MATSRFVLSSRAVRVAAVLVAASIALSVRAAEQPVPPGTDTALAADAQARFVVVPLKRGIALAGRVADRRVEIVGGVVMADGVPLSGDEVRRRFGADADLVLRLSYLDDRALERLFRSPAAAPAPSAQAPVAPARPPAPDAPAAPPPPPVFDRPSPEEAAPVLRRSGARLALAKPIVIRPDEEIRNGVFSMGGPVRVEGRVRDGIVVIGSDLELTPTADVRGDLTVVGGELTIAEGARHAGAIHHTVGADWPGWSWPSFGWSRFEPSGAARWLPFAGTSVRLVLLALAIVVVAAAARGRLTRIGAAAVAAPVRSGLVGLATQILFVPALVVVAVVLAVTIVGLPFIAVVVPLAVLTFLGAMLLGFASLALRLGQAVTGRGGEGPHPVLAALAGMALLVLPTLVARLAGLGPDALRWPAVTLLVLGAVVEYAAWTVGLGAAVTTGLGRWAVVPPPVPPPPPFSTEPPVADAPSAI
jgi:hypothetical protein